jgi:hypothetical protein
MKQLRAARQPVTHCTPFQILDWPHISDSRDLLNISLDVAFRHDKAHEHAPRNPENAFLGIKFYPMFSQREHLREVGGQIACLLRLDHDVVDICLNYPAYKISKDASHASLERGTLVLEPERHHR